MIEGTPQTTRCCSWLPDLSYKQITIGGVAVGVIIAITAILVAYFSSHTVQVALNHIFSQIQNGQMSVGQGLLCITVPVGGLALLVLLVIRIKRASQMQQRSDLMADAGTSLVTIFGLVFRGKPSAFRSNFNQARSEIKEWLKETRRSFTFISQHLLTEKEQRVLLWTAATLFVATALTVFFLAVIPGASHWASTQALPAVQHLMAHKFQAWQVMAVSGGATLMIAAALVALGCRGGRKADPIEPPLVDNTLTDI